MTECSIISQNVRNHLLKNEVLRRCEGVGRLLLRHPGEAIAMRKRLGKCKIYLEIVETYLCILRKDIYFAICDERDRRYKLYFSEYSHFITKYIVRVIVQNSRNSFY